MKNRLKTIKPRHLLIAFITTMFFCLFACAGKYGDPLLHLLRIQGGTAAKVIVATTPWLEQDRVYDTTVELLRETRKFPGPVWDLGALKQAFIRGVEQGGLDLRTQDSSIEEEVLRFEKDPRQSGVHEYALAVSPQVPDRSKREWTPRKEAHQRRLEAIRPQDAKRPRVLLIPAERSVDGVEEVFYYGIRVGEGAAKKNEMILFVSLDRLSESQGGEYTFATHARLVLPGQKLLAWEAKRQDRCEAKEKRCDGIFVEANESEWGLSQMAQAAVFALGRDFAKSASVELSLAGAKEGEK